MTSDDTSLQTFAKYLGSSKVNLILGETARTWKNSEPFYLPKPHLFWRAELTVAHLLQPLLPVEPRTQEYHMPFPHFQGCWESILWRSFRIKDRTIHWLNKMINRVGWGLHTLSPSWRLREDSGGIVATVATEFQLCFALLRQSSCICHAGTRWRKWLRLHHLPATEEPITSGANGKSTHPFLGIGAERHKMSQDSTLKHPKYIQLNRFMMHCYRIQFFPCTWYGKGMQSFQRVQCKACPLRSQFLLSSLLLQLDASEVAFQRSRGSCPPRHTRVAGWARLGYEVSVSSPNGPQRWSSNVCPPSTKELAGHPFASA